MAARRRRGLLLALRRAGGLIGFGDLARAFTPLLAPFGCPIKAYDPWVSDHFMGGFGVVSASLEGVPGRVVDFSEFLRQVERGRLRAATDIFPQEPAPSDAAARKVEGLLLSPHRAGAMTDALYEIGRQTVADAALILRGLPPLSCRRAQRERVALSRSKPIAQLTTKGRLTLRGPET